MVQGKGKKIEQGKKNKLKENLVDIKRQGNKK